MKLQKALTEMNERVRLEVFWHTLDLQTRYNILETNGNDYDKFLSADFSLVDLKKIAKLIPYKHLRNLINGWNNTDLIKQNHTEIAKLLSMFNYPQLKELALKKFIKDGNLDGIKFVINSGAQFDFKKTMNALLESEHCSEELIAYMINLQDITTNFNEFVRTAILRTGDVKYVKMFFNAHPELVNIKVKDYLFSVIPLNGSKNSTGLFEYGLEIGANIHAKQDAALRWTCRYKQWKLVEWLLDNGANPAAKNYESLCYAKSSSTPVNIIMRLTKTNRKELTCLI